MNNRASEGVGKKIVEALKKQSEIEVNAIPAGEFSQEENLDFGSENLDILSMGQEIEQNQQFQEDDLLSSLSFGSEIDSFSDTMQSVENYSEQALKADEPIYSQASQPRQQVSQPQLNQQFANPSPQVGSVVDNFVNELDNFEVPSNIAVLKKLITQLPSGVTRHTGAQIIRQTMEALGISMKSVLQEAQQLQDGLSNSARECQNTIQEYKKQIIALEKQSQNHQRQYAALNELISLFVQTTNR